MGAPLFTEELFETILDLHAEGETIRAICRLQGMPKPRTFYEWLANDEALQVRFKAARRVAMDCKAEEAEEISRTVEVGIIEKLERVAVPWTDEEKAREKEHPGSVETRFEYVVTETRRKDMTEHRRLKVDTILKLLAKWDTRYNDRLAIDHGAQSSLEALITQSFKPAT
jgi:hypothetical protein